MANTEKAKGKAVANQPTNQPDAREARESFFDHDARLRFALEAGQLGDWELDLATYRTTRSLQHDKIFGYETLLPEWTFEMFLQHLHPADREAVGAKFDQALAAQTDLEFECRILRADGQPAWIWVRSTVHLDAQGQPARMLGVVRDITIRKGAEEELQQSEARYRALVEATSQAVWNWNPHHLTGDFSATQRWWAQITGQSPEEQSQGEVGWLAMVHPDDREAAQTAWMQAMETGVDYNVEYRVRSRQGSYVSIISRAVAIREPDGTVREWVGTMADVTEKRQAEEALQQTETHFRAAAEATPNAFFILRAIREPAHNEIIDFEFVDLNVQGEKLVGLSRDQALGGRLLELLPANRDLGFFDKYKQVVEQGTPIQEEFSQCAAGHEDSWFWQQVVPLDDGITITTVDITERKQAEEALRESEALFRVLTEVMPQLVWTSDPEGNIDFCNNRWLGYTGLTVAEIWGEGWAQALHPDDRATTFAAWRRSVETDQEYQVEQRLRSATGEYRWFLTRALPYRDETGRIIKWYGTCTDIEDRKQAEHALKASEREFRAIFELAGSGKAQADPITHRFTRVNPKFCEITGYSEEELLNLTFTDLTHPDDRPRDIELMSPALRGEQESWQMEKRYLRKDGQIIWGIVTGSLIRDDLGRPLRTIATIHDITDRKQAEEALARSERLYRAIGESINYGIWVCEPDGRNIYASESFLKLVGLTQEACSEFGWGNVLHPDEAEATMAAWKECTRTGSFWEREHRFRGVDGRWHYILARGVPLKDGEGRILCWAGINLDITALKQTEQALRESEERLRASETQLRVLNQTLEQRVAERTAELERSLKELDQFAYVASHDLKAPLRAVNHLAGWIIQDAGDLLPEPSKLHLAKMQGRIQRMDKLLNDLLVYSRAGRNYYTKASKVDTGTLVTEIVELLAPPPDFTITIQEKMPVLRTYPVLLELVFRNLIDNALKHHHRPDGQVTISAREAGDFIEFSVADNGPGIEEAFHERVFQIFQTLQPRDEVEGSGVGLAIVKKAVESQNGSVSLTSTRDQGATFRFTWPKG